MSGDAPEGVTLGRVVGAHGLRGEVRVRLLGDGDENLRAADTLWLVREEGDRKAVEARVRAVGSGRRGEARLALEGIEGRDAAEALRGCLVQLPASDLGRLRELSDGEYYQYELIGCRVEDVSGRALGVVQGVWETGAPDVLVVSDGEGEGSEHLIPAAQEFLREVDLEARRIVVEVPEGLLQPAKSEEQ